MYGDGGEGGNLRGPGHGVAEDEETGGDDHELADAGVRRRVLGGTCSREDEEPRGLPDTANDEGATTAEVLHDVDAAERAAKVDGAEDDLGDIRVGDADGLEDRGTVLYMNMKSENDIASIYAQGNARRRSS